MVVAGSGTISVDGDEHPLSRWDVAAPRRGAGRSRLRCRRRGPRVPRVRSDPSRRRGTDPARRQAAPSSPRRTGRWMAGWRGSVETDDGAVESEQRVALSAPVVEFRRPVLSIWVVRTGTKSSESHGALSVRTNRRARSSSACSETGRRSFGSADRRSRRRTRSHSAATRSRADCLLGVRLGRSSSRRSAARRRPSARPFGASFRAWPRARAGRTGPGRSTARCRAGSTSR